MFGFTLKPSSGAGICGKKENLIKTTGFETLLLFVLNIGDISVTNHKMIIEYLFVGKVKLYIANNWTGEAFVQLLTSCVQYTRTQA